MLELNLNVTPDPKAQNRVSGPVFPQTDTVYDTLIIGAGPAGLNAALYLKRKGRAVAVFGDRVGGQMQDTSQVENYIGVSMTNGYELSQRFGNDVQRLEIPVLEHYQVTNWQQKDRIFEIVVDSKTYKGLTLLIATGSTPRHLNIPGEDKFTGLGVSYCAICDGPLFRGKRIVVVGGGNAAVEGALDLARIASELTVVQRSTFRADRILMDQVEKHDNVTLLTQTEMEGIEGDEFVEGIRVFDKVTKEQKYIETDAVFIEIGHNPNTALFDGHVDTNKNGEIIIDKYNRTSVAGIYAAGDVSETMYKQIVVAAADGASAALSINNDLTTKK